MPAEERYWHRDALPQGTIINGYTIARIIGRGGFGITYEASNALGQNFAIKECFPRQFACRQGLDVMATSSAEEEAYADCRDRFLREGRALAHLAEVRTAQERVVRVNTFFEAYGTAYLVMELLRGPTLEDLINENPNGLAPDLVRDLMEEVLQALGSVHETRLLHRDLKPSNIKLREAGRRPVLIDFGAVRASSHAQTTIHTNFTRFISQGYTPIEQFAGNLQGPMSDIYAFGATFYRAIGGKPVDANERYRALQSGKPDPLPPAQEIGAGRYPPPLLLALDEALRVAPEDRPQTVAELLGVLRGSPPTIRDTRSAGMTAGGESSPKPANGGGAAHWIRGGTAAERLWDNRD